MILRFRISGLCGAEQPVNPCIGFGRQVRLLQVQHPQAEERLRMFLARGLAVKVYGFVQVFFAADPRFQATAVMVVSGGMAKPSGDAKRLAGVAQIPGKQVALLVQVPQFNQCRGVQVAGGAGKVPGGFMQVDGGAAPIFVAQP